MNDSDTELSDFTKLVLARLETNPDEFQLGGRWDTLVRGIEAFVRGDQEDRYYRTLWPLDDPEVRLITTAYRKAYLARLHKDMLKNIVSGDDLPQKMDPRTYTVGTLGNDVNPLKGGVLRGNSPSTVLTTAAMQQATLTSLQESFKDAIVKGEGQAVVPDQNTAYTYKPTNRYVLNKTQVEIARKLNMSPTEYARYVEAAGALINTGGRE